MSSLPPAVARKAARAAELIKQGQQPPAAPAGTPPVDDSAKKLADAQAEIERLTRQFNAERVEEGRLRRANELNKELEEKLRKKDAELQAAAAAAPQASVLTEDEERLLGDLKDPFTKLARDIVLKETATLLKPVNERMDQFARMSEAAFGATIEQYVPDWESQNEDQRFLAWLNQIDPATHLLRMDLLKRAEAARQGFRVAEIFLAFRENRDIETRGAALAQHPNIDHGPGSGNPPPVDNTSQAGTISRAEIAAFYRDKARGHYRGKDKEAAEIEAQINAAVTQGKVTA